MEITDEQLQYDLLAAVALAEFSYRYEDTDPELAKQAWQLAASRLVEYDVEPYEAVDELGISDS